MIKIGLKLVRFHFVFSVWVYDPCIDERILFQAVAGRDDRHWGISSTWFSRGGHGSLTWYLFTGKKRRGWQLVGPLRRIA